MTCMSSISASRVALVLSLLPLASSIIVGPTPIPAAKSVPSLRPVSAAVGAPHAATALLLSHAAISARARAIQMFEGPPPEPEDEDVWEEIANEMTKTQKVLKGLHPIAMGTANNAIVVLAALTAWFLMPPAAPVVVTSVPVVGSGFLGRRFGKRLNRLRSETAPASVAEVVAAALNFKSLDPDDVERVAERYGLDPDEFQRVLSTVYGRYLRSVVAEDDAVDTRQVTQLAQLRRGLGLGWNGTVTAHNGEATTLTGGTPPPKGQTPPEAQRLLWLTAILFGASKGQASAADLQATLGLDADEAAEVVGELSSPLYRKAVSRAVAKFNLTEAPDVLQKARATLQLGEDSSARIHSQMYDAQLGMLLEGDGAGLDDSALALLGELEAMLQLRGSSGLMQARTVPMYRAAAASELRALLDGKTGASVWGSMAVRQQQLSLPSDRSKPVVVEEARRIALEQLAAAATAQAAGRTDEAQATLQKLLSYASAYGTMLQAAAWEADSANPDDLAAQYLGALTLDEALEAPARALAEATSGDTLKAMLARYLAEYDGAPRPRPRCARCQPQWRVTPHPDRRSPALPPRRAGPSKEYASLLDELISSGGYAGAAVRSWQDKLAARAADLGLPAALRQRLSLDTYYTWLLDLTEKMDVAQLEKVADLRGCLQLYDSSLGELYTETEIDELVLAKVAESFVAGNLRKRLTADQRGRLTYLEAELQARPGSAARVGDRS